MNSHFIRIVSMLALVFSLFPAAALAGSENEVKFTGTVQGLPSSGFTGDWTVAGKTVHVGSSTQINQEHGQITTGATVKVEGTQRADSSVDATSIELQEASSGGDDHGGGSGGSGGDDHGGGSGGSGGDDHGGGGSDDGSGSSGSTFKGTIESFPAAGFAGDWHVGGRTIHVTAATRIETSDGPVAVGAFVEIEGTVRADGSMDATKIEVKSNPAGGDGRDELKGTIQSLPATATLVGDWTVSGHTVHVTAATVINREHGAAAIGASVEVKGTARADGSIDAASIEVNPSSGGSGEGQPASVKGSIQSLPSSADMIGDWTVSGQTIHVVSSTKLNREHGAFVVGARVKVKGMQMSDGTVVATKIQLRDSQ